MTADLYAAALDPSAFGESAFYVIGETERVTCCVINPKVEPLMTGGQLVFDENHFSAVLALDTPPEVGARLLVSGGIEYRIDAPPAPSVVGWVWNLVLRRMVWPGSGSAGAPDVVSERYLTAAERAAYEARLAALEGHQLPAGLPGEFLRTDADGNWIASDTLPVE